MAREAIAKGVGVLWFQPGTHTDEAAGLAPSLFGYLGSTLPEGATPATQADAFASLLDYLEVSQVVLFGYSAGGPSAIQFALRHRDRTTALVLMASALPGKAGAPPKFIARTCSGRMPSSRFSDGWCQPSSAVSWASRQGSGRRPNNA